MTSARPTMTLDEFRLRHAKAFSIAETVGAVDLIDIDGSVRATLCGSPTDKQVMPHGDADDREELLIEAFLAAEFGYEPPCLCLPSRESDHGPRCPLVPEDGVVDVSKNSY